MNILILNAILFTPDNGIIPKVKSIKDTMIYNMCLGFKQLGHSITLAAAEEYRPTEEEKYEFDIIFFKSKFTRIFQPTVLPYSSELKQYIRLNHSKFDLIISSETFSFQSFFASRICPKKTIIWQELTTHQRKFHQIPSKIWHNFIAKYLIKRICITIPRSKQAQDFIKKYIPTSTEIVDHGINIQKFNAETNKKRQIISSAQLIYRKNIDGIIKIFSKFIKSPKYSDIKLIIAGRGNELENLQKLVKGLNITESVKFVGFLPQSELNVYIRESLCFLVNTRKDLNMVSIPEAIASATPILTNTIPASADYIKANALGIVKDEWGNDELSLIIDNNKTYVENCFNYRNKLTNTYCAQTIIDIFKQNFTQ